MKRYPFQTKDKAKWSEAHSLAINSLLQMRPSVHSYVGGGQCLVYRRDSGTPEPLLIKNALGKLNAAFGGLCKDVE